MSDLLVRDVKIDEIVPHPNADKLEIVKVGGWQIVSGKDNYIVGDLVVHVPPDALVPLKLAQEWEVDKYLAFGKRSPDLGRVRAARLRGIPSYGFLAPNDTFAALGTDLAAHYAITKYEPPPPPAGLQAGQMARNHPFFHRYTDIQNLRNYPDKLDYAEPLVVTEKLHGTNSRVGWVLTPDPEHVAVPDALEKAVGTHRTQRKTEEPGVYGLPFQLYGEALDKAFKRILVMMAHPDFGKGEQVRSVIFFGEIYGPGVQDLTYGKERAWRVFDISVNGDYLSWPHLKDVCEEFGIPLVPYVHSTFYNFEELCALAQGETALNPGQIKEGIVVRTNVERRWKDGDRDPSPKRMIFKVISDEYLLRKNGTEHH
jgi:RNA ligase (TIGR02306 family)